MEIGLSLSLTACRTKGRIASPALIFIQGDGNGTVSTTDTGKGREAELPCPGHGGRCEAWRRRTLAFGVRPLLTGGRRSDRLPFCRHETGERPSPAPAPLRLCAFAFSGGRVGLVTIFVASCLRGFGWVGGSVPSLCALCLRGSAGRVGGNPKSEIRNGRAGIPDSQFLIPDSTFPHLVESRMSQTFKDPNANPRTGTKKAPSQGGGIVSAGKDLSGIRRASCRRSARSR
jgi:hypothetical protein